MKRLSKVFLVLIFSLFTAHSFAKTNYIIVLNEDFSKQIKYKKLKTI
jgi:hypothetical protein